jgi:hypothetical protein
MYEPHRLLSMIQTRMEELGMSQAQLGLVAFGKANNSAFQALKSGSSPGVDRLEAMATALGFELYFGPKRASAVGGMAEPEGRLDKLKPAALQVGYLPIPWHDRHARRGLQPVAIHANWFSERGLDVSAVRAVHPERDYTGLPAMTSAMVLVDTSRLDPPPGALFVWRSAGKFCLGFLQRIDSKIVRLGQGLGEPAEVLDSADLQIVGAVVYTTLAPKGAERFIDYLVQKEPVDEYRTEERTAEDDHQDPD